jgi:pimeloyl-ACP methyl ester carboxylesterase
VAPDIIGFGYSDKPTVEYTMDFFLDFLATFLKNLGILKPVIVASSFGGHLATEYAVGHSRQIEKLVLVSPAGMMRTSTPVLDSYIMSALYPTYENSEKAFSAMSYDPAVVSDDVINDFVNRMKLPNSKYAFMSTLLGMRYAPRLQGRLGKITCPTLLLWGDSDKMIPVQYAKEYREIPDLELVVIKNCGHVPFIEKPMTFNKLVLRFLLGNQMSL